MFRTGAKRKRWSEFLCGAAFFCLQPDIFVDWALFTELYACSLCPFGIPLTTTQIITNVFVQAIILLYLIDNNENTSWMILLGSGMGVVIEAWKVCHGTLTSETSSHN